MRAELAGVGMIHEVKRRGGVVGQGRVGWREPDGLEPGGTRASLKQEDNLGVLGGRLGNKRVATRTNVAEGTPLGLSRSAVKAGNPKLRERACTFVPLELGGLVREATRNLSRL